MSLISFAVNTPNLTSSFCVLIISFLKFSAAFGQVGKNITEYPICQIE